MYYWVATSNCPYSTNLLDIRSIYILLCAFAHAKLGEAVTSLSVVVESDKSSTGLQDLPGAGRESLFRRIWL